MRFSGAPFRLPPAALLRLGNRIHVRGSGRNSTHRTGKESLEQVGLAIMVKAEPFSHQNILGLDRKGEGTAGAQGQLSKLPNAE